MGVETVLQQLGRFSSRRDAAKMPLTYEPLANNSSWRPTNYHPRAQDLHDDAQSSSSLSSTTYADAHVPDAPRHPARSRPWPSLQAFLADFTLGFADGLTVPFALTAGLSSLGQTSTVLYAGMAEICAGSISMGIGGYLAARGEARAASSFGGREHEGPGRDAEDVAGLLSGGEGGDLEKRAGEHRVSISNDKAEEDLAALARYLAPLRLKGGLEEAVLAHLGRNGYDRDAIVAEMGSAESMAEEPSRSAVLVGISVSLGYLVGGVIPLFPYFFVAEVGTGLLWSFLVCIIALFAFGFGKEFALNGGSDCEREIGERPSSWPRIRSSLWEGFLMVVLGGTAALAAVFCVRLFDGVLG